MGRHIVSALHCMVVIRLVFRDNPVEYLVHISTNIRVCVLVDCQSAGEEADELRDVIAKHGQPDCNADFEMRKLWLDHLDKHTNPIPNLDFLRLDDFSQAQPCINAVINFQNNVPYWKLHGNTPEEIERMEMRKMRQSGQTPKISIGPNLRARGIESWEQIEEMVCNGEDFPDMSFPGIAFQDPYMRTDKKVGRNDPCPCGSGKKYKNCCGR